MKSKILLLLIILVFSNCTPEKASDNSILQLVPENSAVLLKINDLESLKDELEENAIISKIKKEAFAKAISKRLKPLEYLNGEIPGLLAISSGISDSFDFTFIITDSLPRLKLDSIKDKTVESLVYQDYTLTKYQIEENTFFTSKIREREVMSSSQIVLQNIIKRIEKHSFSSELEKLFKTSNSNRLNHIWLNLDEGDVLFQDLLQMDNNSLKISKYASWISLAIDLENDGIKLNGISVTKDSTANYLSLFSKTKPLHNATAAFTPNDVDNFKSYTITDYSVFEQNRTKYLNISSPIDSLLSTIEEIGIAELNQKQIVFLKTFGTVTISDYLSTISSNSIEYQGSEILNLQNTSFLSDYLDPIVTNFMPSHASIIENTFVFSNDEATLKKVINSHKNGNVLEKTMLYKNAQDITTEESSALTLSTSSSFQRQLSAYGLKNIAKALKGDTFKNYVFGSQIVADNNFFHSSYFAKKIDTSESKYGVVSLFNFQTDADIATTPQFVKNHRTNKQEIVVQDQENVLYLISHKGKVLWKKQLESAIQGKIQQVDIYKNGKLQLAFTTNNEFLILDRNGKEVAPFTIKHEGGNLNPLAVFDYDGKKDYRFLVTQGPKVFMYNNKGKIVSGFKYKKAESDILGAPQHFRINKKDYLCFKLANGQLKLLNRVGNIRVKVSENIPFSENDIKLYKNKFTLSTEKGFLYQIDTQGKIEKTNLNLNADHGMDATSKTLAIINDNILRIRDKKVALDLGVYSQPTIFYLNDKIYVSVTDIQNQKSYLFDSQAEAIPDFPIYGSSIIDLTDMDNDKRPELVIKDQDNSIRAYKIR